MILTVPAFMKVFDFEPVNFNLLLFSLLISSVGVFWIEVWKFFKRKKDLKYSPQRAQEEKEKKGVNIGNGE
jgi:Ca2+-transporting ATPase